MIPVKMKKIVEDNSEQHPKKDGKCLIQSVYWSKSSRITFILFTRKTMAMQKKIIIMSSDSHTSGTSI